MNAIELHHIATGMSMIRLTENRPDAGDLVSDPELWASVYFEHRDEVLAAHGVDCEAVRRFEPELCDGRGRGRASDFQSNLKGPFDHERATCIDSRDTSPLPTHHVVSRRDRIRAGPARFPALR